MLKYRVMMSLLSLSAGLLLDAVVDAVVVVRPI